MGWMGVVVFRSRPVVLKVEVGGLWSEPAGVTVWLGALRVGLLALEVEPAVVQVGPDTSEGPASVALGIVTGCVDAAESASMEAGSDALRVGLVAEWPESGVRGAGLGWSPAVGSWCTGRLGPWVRLSGPTASMEASAKAASTLASLMWLRVRL